MYFGNYEHSLDEKGRLMIPRQLRNGLKENCPLYILQGFEGCIAVYSETEFNKLISECQSISFNKKNSRDYLRLVLSSVTELNIDKVGRIQLPIQTLAKYKINKQVTIIGVRDHFEIWDKATFDKYQKEANERFEEIAESLVKENE